MGNRVPLFALMTSKYRAELTDAAGLRRTLLPFDVVAGQPFELNSNHLLLYAGSDWHPMTIEHVAQRKTQANFSLLLYATTPFR